MEIHYLLSILVDWIPTGELERYSRQVLALKLYSAQPCGGGLTIVVMARIEGQSAHELYGDNPLPEDLFSDIQQAMHHLHDKEFVFGDLRPVNIVVRDGMGVANLAPYSSASIGVGKVGPLNTLSRSMIQTILDGMRLLEEMRL